MSACRVCAGNRIEPLLDLGPQPMCNRYRTGAPEPEYLHPMALGQCDACGVVQILDPVPWAEMRPRFDWITYKEPEAHLDNLADILSERIAPGFPRTACGISFKDDPLLDRLKSRGFESVWRMDPVRDLGKGPGDGGVESLQAIVDIPAAREVARRRGRSGLVIARHIFEHCHSIPEFLGALAELVDPRGAIVLELPDCQRALEGWDYSALWEEHVFYFTEQTLRAALTGRGLGIERLVRYPYPMEDVVAVVLKPFGGSIGAATRAGVQDTERATARGFASSLDPLRRALPGHLAADRAAGGVAMFGAGHRACLYINVMNLKDQLQFVVDDDPHKAGLRMPGSGLPILASTELVKRRIRLCLLTVAPENEERISARNREFVESGGRFVSIYPFSRNGLPIADLVGRTS